MTQPVSGAYDPAGMDPGPGWKWRFWSIFAGQALSLTGSAITQFVLIWWITDTTGDLGALAMAGLVALLPQALLGPLGGTFADRYNRRMLMIVSDLLSAFCIVVVIALFLSGRIALWHIYTAMFVRSAATAFQMPAASASEAMLVPRHFLPRVAGLNQTLMGLVTVAAAPLGGLAIAAMPVGKALWIDVGTALLGIAPLLAFAIPQHRLSRSGTGIWTEFREGIGVVWQDARLRRIYALLTAVVLVIMPTFTLLPLLVKQHFGGGAQQVAMLESLGGAGMIAGGAIVAIIVPRRLVSWILWGFSLSCATLALTALMPSGLFWLAAIFWALSGLLFILGDAPFTALIQATVPNQLQGRVLGLLATLMGLAAPIGLLIAAPLGALIGVRWLFVLTGALGTLVSLLAFLSGELRRAEES
ncbi:MFS transporter [Sphingomonas parapaucimobilis]|uniref:Putative drug resistance transporter n=1 Tax=Sphingomonas parapaucimobilis NBRC 15100 TaxID=1219049 RepID=A0A0A1WBP5_9SPHN|nr:MFS transporter [Sphingomonas parapaucimobilis]GAM02436.1 putative drug resistance transporter [Sphingomonas parapaucimobilis NBRC 15100]